MRLHVDADGPEGAPVVLMLHGALASGRAFRGQLPVLRDAYRVLLPDQRGHGRSPHVLPTMDDLAEDALALLDTPAHLVGVSMGGIVAARVATERPELVASLTLISTPPRSEPRWRDYFARTPPDALPLDTQRLARTWHGEPYWRDLARHLFAYFAHPPPAVFEGRPRPPRALVMQGDADELLDPADPERWRARIDAPTTIVRAPGDHAFFADGREGTRLTNRTLRAFLDGTL